MHIGQQIKKVLDSKPKAQTVTWFASQLHCNRRNAYYIFANPTIDTGLLARVCKVLNHDFFADLSEDTKGSLVPPEAPGEPF